MKFKPSITLTKLQKCIDCSTEISKLQETINTKIKKAPLHTLSEFDNLSDPRNNVNTIIEFYERLLKVDENAAKIFELIKLKKNKIYTFEWIEQNQIVENIEKVTELFKSLDEYSDIDCVSDMIGQYDKNVFEVYECLKISFFSALKRFAPDCDRAAAKTAQLLRRTTDASKFDEEFCKIIYQKLKMGEEPNTSEVLNQIGKINEIVEKIQNTCITLFGDEAVTLNRAAKQFLIVDTKLKTSKLLLKIKHKERAEDIVICAAVYSGLREQRSKIEELYDLAEEAVKLAVNLFTVLYVKIGATEIPNKFSDTEKFVESSAKVFKGVVKCKKFTDEILAKCDFISNDGLLSEKVGDKIYNKIDSLMAMLSGVSKCVYAINNFSVIARFYNSDLLLRMCDEQCDIICAIWDRELNLRKGGDVTSFVDSNLLHQKTYKLPDVYRNRIVENIQQLLKRHFVDSVYKNDKKLLDSYINDLFKGV